MNDNDLEQKHWCSFVWVFVFVVMLLATVFSLACAGFSEELSHRWSASVLQESLEAVAKENKELQAQISQLAAELDGRMLHRLDGV